MDRKRSLATGVIILSLAFGAGHLVQGKASAGTPLASAKATPADDPKPELAVATPETLPKPELAELQPVAPVTLIPEPADKPAEVTPVNTDPMPEPEPTAAVVAAVEKDFECPVHLDLVPQDGAMIGLTLVAPCHADERITISHAGLTVTGRTTSTGSLFSAIPAMDVDGEVTITFADNTDQSAVMPMPELADMRRVAVQWMGDDRFALNVFKDGADYGQTGHLTAQPMAMLDGLMEPGSTVIGLGDETVPLPLLAEVYTLPSDATPVELTLEAEVTEKTCARELLGEMLESRNGAVTVQELTLAMPECDALGDFIVLNNLLPDLTLAAANEM